MTNKQEDDLKKERKGLNLISGFAPDTFLKPVILISTFADFEGNNGSTAICFCEGLNRFHAMEIMFSQDSLYKKAGWTKDKHTDFIEIMKHDNWKKAKKYHLKLIEGLNYRSYIKLYEQYYPKEFKDVIR